MPPCGALSEFKGVTSIHPLLTIGDRIVLYPYISKKHAELAPGLAVVLKEMKAEGLLERSGRRRSENDVVLLHCDYGCSVAP